MGVYIKGMRKPKVCREKASWNMQDIGCRFCIDGGWGYECMFTGYAIDKVNVLDADCPLIEVKAPHGRLIDADALCERLMTEWSSADELGRKIISGIMADVVTPIVVGTPTVIEEEVE